MLALAATLLALAAPPVHCDSGATMYVDGPLRVFGTAFRRHEAGNIDAGHDQYACLGTRGPTALGEDVTSTGAYGAGVVKYVFAGARYLAVASYNYGEGGGDQTLEVLDLRTKRRVKWMNAAWDDDAGPNIRLSANGDLVTGGEGTIAVHPRGHKDQVLAAKDATGLAVAGTTVYWTAPDGPHSATLGGSPSEEPDSVLDPVAFSRANPCDSRRGTTLARTPKLRVLRRGKRTLACRIGDRRAVTLPRGSDLHLAGDRWLSVAASDDDVEVIDLRTRRVVTRAFRGVRQALLTDGTLIVNDGSGLLTARTPGAKAATTLEAAGARALATTGTTVYWTDGGGAAHSSTI